MKYLKTTEIAKVESYPYGNLKTIAYFSLEHKTGKGFRTVFQTINPKTERLNKPKKGTYYPIIAMNIAENGHIKYDYFSFYDNESKLKCIKFLSEYFGIYTNEQIKDIAAYCLTSLKLDMKAQNEYYNSPIDKLISLYNNAVEILVNIYSTGENLFSQINLDFDAIEALKDKNYNPFRPHIKLN